MFSNGQYSVKKKMWFKTPMIRSDLWDYSDVDVVVNGTIAHLAAPAKGNDKSKKDVAFKNNASFRSCILKINNTLTENGEDFDIVMPMYSLLECSSKYSMTSESLWN